jgi:tripartite-type tricarboxylate transporter receptor subunit TctC
MRTLLGFCLLVGATIASPIARAQDVYPNKPITLVVPVPPGGAADFIARLVGRKLSDALGQPVVISNRGGASGTIASDNVAKAAPDGYTLLLNSITTHGIGPHLNTNLPYDSVKDFSPVIYVASLPLVMTISAERPEKSVKEVVEFAKVNPGKLSFASSGNGGAPHLAGELFQTVTGIKMLHVPYRGSGPAVIDVGAGRVDIMFDAVPSLLALIQAGKLRPLAAASVARNPIVPEVSTFGELGFKGMEISLWYGVVGPAQLPQPIIQRLNREIAKGLEAAEVKENFAKQGVIAAGGSPQDFAKFMQDEYARWGQIVRANNIKLE